MKQSLPTVQPQPGTPVFGSAVLNLFMEALALDRPIYEAVFNEQAPQFDPALPIKKWKDDSKAALDPELLVSYIYYKLGADGAVHEMPLTMTARTAAKVNLTGAIHFPPYVIKESQVTIGGFHVAKEDLSTHDEADSLALEIGRQKSDVVENTANQPFVYFYPPDEQRRVWMIQWGPDRQINVGRKLLAKNSQGVGAPFHWVFPQSPNQEPNPFPDPPVTGETGAVHPQMPVPQRKLLANEEFVTGADAFMSGVGFVVHRTDLAAAAVAGGAVGGGLTAQQAADLKTIKVNTSMLVALAQGAAGAGG